jgi:hypothetical protein
MSYVTMSEVDCLFGKLPGMRFRPFLCLLHFIWSKTSPKGCGFVMGVGYGLELVEVVDVLLLAKPPPIGGSAIRHPWRAAFSVGARRGG